MCYGMVSQISNLQWEKMKLNFIRTQRLCSRNTFSPMPAATEATLPDSFHLDQDLRLLLISFHPLLLIDSGSNFQMWKQQIIDNKSRAQAIWEVDKLIQLRSLHTTSPLFALVAAMHYSLLSSIKYRQMLSAGPGGAEGWSKHQQL